MNWGERYYFTGSSFIGLRHLGRREETSMTSQVKVSAHCGPDTAVRIQVVGQAPVLLRDGEEKELSVYDDLEVRVREIHAPVEEKPLVTISDTVVLSPGAAPVTMSDGVSENAGAEADQLPPVA